MLRRLFKLCLLTGICGLPGMGVLQAGDWPQILGPQRNGIAQDEQLARRWTREGPPQLWEKRVGSGYAGLAVVGNRAVLFHRIGDEEVIEALDATTGQTLYADSYPTTFEPQVGSENGPLCVPVIHGDNVITFGAQGVLTCLNFRTGERLWQRQTHRDFKAPEGYFGAGSSPIVVNDLVIVNVGGTKTDAGIVAFSLKNGETVWTRTNEPASYAAPVLLEMNGTPLVMMITRYQCQMLDPKTGTILFQFPFGQRGPTVNAAAPLILKDRLLVTAAYGIGMVYGEFNLLGFRTLYREEGPIATQYCTPIHKDGYVYVIDGRDDVPPADLKCVELSALSVTTDESNPSTPSGKVASPVKWVEQDFGYGTLLLADDKLLAMKTTGELLLMNPDPEGMKVISKCRPLSGTVRALPALSNGKFLIRDEKVLKCLDLGR
ncbi:PQQ-binding-like beta-propeller repeat protein [Planctomicrobium sp. SH661]|uniref:outer membrane protein assembly factor BamB family protein n=1 Tax=Planctomicrobium sp. SH661 TaxID=3448124 RepID=UPI003F5B1A7F